MIRFLHGHILLHLDNPDPVERETISNLNPKNPNIRPDWTAKSESCTLASGGQEH